MQHAVKLIDMTHMRSNYAALSLRPPTQTADLALSYSYWQHCLILVYSTWDMERWGHAHRNLICEGMCLYVFQHCTVLLVSCEQQCLRYRDKQEALFKASNHIYFMSMFVASLPLCCPSHTAYFSSPERRRICVQGTVAVLESDVVGSHCMKKDLLKVNIGC